MMYKTVFSAVGITVIAAFLCVGCGGGGGQTRPSELVGQWEHASGAKYDKPDNLELFKDGTGVVDGGTISWKVENKRLVILSSSEGLACNYKVSGYELALAYDDGDSAIFLKKGSVKAFFTKGEREFYNGNFDDALAALTEAIRLDSKLSEAYRYRAMILYNYRPHKKDYDGAIADLNQAIKLKPDDETLYHIRAVVWNRKNNYDRAIADCNKAIQLKPDNAKAYYSRGFAYAGKKDYDNAISDYTKALQLPSNIDVNSLNCILDRGTAYNEKGEYQKAISDFNAVLKISQGSEEIEKKAKAGLERAQKGSGK